MDRITFLLSEPGQANVRVSFRLDARGRLSIYCTCHDALLLRFCDHRLRILEGRVEGVAASAPGDFAIARSWVWGTEIEESLRALRACQGAPASVIADAQAELARAMNG